MKSYARSPILFKKAARQAIGFGADHVYIVDSAGNLTPKMTRTYCERLSDLSFGFHAHNNLGLAVANSMVAADCGAAIIDCSLQGMGRSAGNTQIEQFVGIMQREGKLLDIDLMRLLDISETFIRPLLSQIGSDTIDVICGYSGFHSSYMKVIQEFSLKYDIDPRRLIVEVCSENIAFAPADLVERKAKEIRAITKEEGFNHRFSLAKYFGEEQNEL